MSESADITGDIVDDIIRADVAVRTAIEVLHRTVIDAREDGVTWAEIGEALGVTKQAAHSRFNHPMWSGRVDQEYQSLQEERLFDV